MPLSNTGTDTLAQRFIGPDDVTESLAGHLGRLERRPPERAATGHQDGPSEHSGAAEAICAPCHFDGALSSLASIAALSGEVRSSFAAAVGLDHQTEPSGRKRQSRLGIEVSHIGGSQFDVRLAECKTLRIREAGVDEITLETRIVCVPAGAAEIQIAVEQML